MQQQDNLAELFAAEFLSGKSYASIVEARSQAAQLLNQSVRPGSPLAKLVDESIEAGLVRAARSIIGQSLTPIQTYADLVDLYNRQPRLSVRSSTSVRQQAYSTPLPIAYLAANLAGVTAKSTVYEPSAGHGALVLNATPENCTINELNPDRAGDLRRQGFSVTEQDASAFLPDQLHDVVIANPPFGRTKGENGRTKRFQLPGNPRGTSQIDHAIAMQALKAMKPDGRAVLILGGKPETDPGERAEAYNTLESRGFFYPLYQQYGVTQHFTISGDLYKKQGAGWPLDVIVIEGKGTSQRPLPAVEPPQIYESFEELRGILNDSIQASTNLRTIPELHKSLDAPGIGGPSDVSGESANRTRDDGVQNLSGSDELSDGMDVRELDQVLRPFQGQSTEDALRHPSAASPNPGSTESIRRGRGEADVDLGNGVGGKPIRVQRDMGAMDETDQSRGQLSSGPDTPATDISGVIDGEARRGDHRPISDGIESRIQVDDILIEDSTVAEEFNTAYVPRSQGRSPDTLIPTNMAVSAQQALDRFEQEHGNIDEFVMNRLGYDSKGQMFDVLYAEQIDSLALAFDQKDKGKIFLNGDQTGNGKGRFGAANIIDAQRQGYIPIFVTQKPNLYASMIQDLADIGRPGCTPFMTNAKLSLNLTDGRTLRTGGLADQENEMHRLTQIGLGGYDAIFTTYNQLQAINNKEPYRRQFLRALASRAVFIFDEAHEAGGGQGQSWKRPSDASNRAEFVRELVDASAGTIFMSATATKNPAVMDLYARRTDAIHAVNSMENLSNTLKAGGIPLQQMMATQFVSAGNMLRRERTFENISFNAKTVPVDHEIADNISAIMRAIDRFDQAKDEAVKEMKKVVRKEAKSLSEDNSIGKSGARSVSFTSLMHNAIDQGLLAQKAETTVQEAIASLQRGEKPLIALASTMDSFIGDFAKGRNIQTGDPINISFADVLKRYLVRSKDIQIKNYDGDSDTRPMTEAELGAEAIAAYQEAYELITESDFSQIPLSSIDYMKHRLSQEGYTVDEITGRQSIINYEGGELTYGLRSNSETKPQAKIDVVNRFNGGDLDVVILNRSGATGINLHASERFADQRPRHMIVAQAERDINQVMQMLGRANRFGQVVEPNFTLVMADVPAEKRLGAMLVKKMASLNANTTASRDSDLSVGNVTDFMNAAGEEVVTELIDEHPELDAMLSYPSRGDIDGEIGLISKVTGRIPLLPIKQQAELYDLIETETTALIQQKEAMGENVLEADKLDLDARTIAKMEVVPADAAIKSEFTGPVNLEVVNAKVTTKPPTQLEIINNVRENLGQSRVKTVDDHDSDAIEDQAKEQNRGLRNQVKKRLETYSQKAMGEAKTPEAASHLETKFDKQMGHFQAITNRFQIGSTVQLASAEGKVSYGVVANIAQKAKPLGSPAAPTNWKMQIITSEGKNISVPFSKINSGKPSAVTIKPQEKTWKGESIYEDFDQRQQNLRTEMQVFTGNLIKAYEEHPKGKFVNFTTNQGQVRQGLIMPDDFDITKQLRERPVIFEEPYQVKAFLTEVTKNLGAVHDNPEKNLAIKADAAAKLRGTPIDHFVITVPSSTRVGGKFFLNEDLLDAAQSEFFSVANRMEMHVAPENLEAALKVIMKDEGIQIAAFDFKDMARDYLGQMLPTMEQIEENQFEQQADFVPYVEPTKDTATQLDMLLQSDAVEPSETPQVEAIQSAPDQAAVQPTQDNTKQIAPPANQTGKAEKFVAQFLHEGGLAQEILKGDDFHFEIKNGPYEPLVVERITDQLSLTHYRERDGDLCLDSEMVFGIDGQGKLNLEETAVQNPFTGREARELDQEFGELFAANIIHQGFAEAALEQLPELLRERQAEQAEVSEPSIAEAPKQAEPEPDKTIEEPVQGVESRSVQESPTEQTVTPLQEPTATAKAEQPQQEPTAQQDKGPQPKPKPQAKPEDWPKYASALKRGNAYQARVKERVAAYKQGTSLNTRASLAMGKDFKEFTQGLNSLKDWYRTAQKLKHDIPYLEKIAKVGNQFKQGGPISDRARAAMKQDINQLAYNRFSAGLNPKNPQILLTRLAANAAKAGLAPPKIMGALSVAPAVKSIRYQEGEQASLKYSRKIMMEGLKLKKQEQPKTVAPKQQRTQDVNQNQGLGR
ncbi:strawberry notch C-terminal domain-containing protein [Acaryochloris marina]|uniref:strawberry notch C-terminal domain-containing protein n=1 Tax=Acaryochloris marina TaxID=155978 RepID=UPI001BB0D28A|nr:strawberry notch C-terminal domain-containing protein [Acaryochloris marina]QUY45446.1 strawberry notch C-terminal domain-containing protein [Acaryochloris marina S15]